MKRPFFQIFYKMFILKNEFLFCIIFGFSSGSTEQRLTLLLPSSQFVHKIVAESAIPPCSIFPILSSPPLDNSLQDQRRHWHRLGSFFGRSQQTLLHALSPPPSFRLPKKTIFACLLDPNHPGSRELDFSIRFKPRPFAPCPLKQTKIKGLTKGASGKEHGGDVGERQGRPVVGRGGRTGGGGD